MFNKYFVSIFIVGAFLISCSRVPSESFRQKSVSVDLDSIIKRGKLRAVTDLNSANYFIYQGEPMGFHYELLKAFTDHLGVDLELVTETNIRNAFNMLNSGDVDLLAMGLTVTPERYRFLRFSEPVDSTRQVIVQRKPHGWQKLSAEALESKLVREPDGLENKSIYVQIGSVHGSLLSRLRDEAGMTFSIVEVPFDPETLIQLVNNGEIEYAACDENIARLNASYLNDIDISMKLTENQTLAWGLRKYGSDSLNAELDKWIRDFKGTRIFAIIYYKYYKRPGTGVHSSKDNFAYRPGRVSQWDELIKENSIIIKWDWRLLASLIYQESRFMPDVESKAGAYGLMQIMPSTGKHLGIDIKASPGNNIKAGIEYINWLHKIFDPRIADSDERTKFILAAYNAGPGHVLDAMKLAEKNGMDPEIWEGNVAEWLQKKSDPRYYNDSLVKNGYFRGKESIAFVNQILDRFEHYKNLVNDN